MGLLEAVKCAIVSMDSTIRSNISVAPPLDILVYRKDTQKAATRQRLQDDDYPGLAGRDLPLALVTCLARQDLLRREALARRVIGGFLASDEVLLTEQRLRLHVVQQRAERLQVRHQAAVEVPHVIPDLAGDIHQIIVYGPTLLV